MSTKSKKTPRHTLIAATLVLTLMIAIPAAAKGPVSAELSGPGLNEPLDLMGTASDEQITLLMEQTGLWYGTGDLPTPISPPTADLGPAHTLTWVNFGPPGAPVAERTIVQELYLQAIGGPIIHTPMQKSLGEWGQKVIGWFEAPAGFFDTLSGLGVEVRVQSRFSEASRRDLATAAAARYQTGEASPLDASVSPTGVTLLVAGVIGGAAVARMVLLAISRRPRRERRGRRPLPWGISTRRTPK